MKTVKLIIAILFAPMLLMAQNKAITAFQEKYKDDRDASYIEISGSLFKFISSINAGDNEDIDPDLAAIAKIADGLTSMKILKIDKYASDVTSEEIANLKSSLKKDSYESLMSMKDGRKNINFMAQGKANELRNMLILVDDKEEFVIINIDGVLTSEDLSYLSRHYSRWD